MADDPIPRVPVQTPMFNEDGRLGAGGPSLTLTRTWILFFERLLRAAKSVKETIENGLGGSGPFQRTFLVKDTTVGDNVGDNVTTYGAEIKSPSTIRRIKATWRIVGTANLVVRFRVMYPTTGEIKTIGTFTLPTTQDVRRAKVFPATDIKWDTLPDLGVLMPDIIASDGAKDKNGIATFEIEWVGRGAGAATAEGMVYRGQWDADSTYLEDDVVEYGGSSYISLRKDNTGNQPDTSTDWWGLIAAKGADGAAGADGAPGDTGPPGPVAITTKGDLATFDTAITRLPVGDDGEILTADSNEPTGLRWGPPPVTQVLDLLADAGMSLIYDGGETILDARNL